MGKWVHNYTVLINGAIIAPEQRSEVLTCLKIRMFIIKVLVF